MSWGFGNTGFGDNFSLGSSATTWGRSSSSSDLSGLKPASLRDSTGFSTWGKPKDTAPAWGSGTSWGADARGVFGASASNPWGSTSSSSSSGWGAAPPAPTWGSSSGSTWGTSTAGFGSSSSPPPTAWGAAPAAPTSAFGNGFGGNGFGSWGSSSAPPAWGAAPSAPPAWGSSSWGAPAASTWGTSTAGFGSTAAPAWGSTGAAPAWGSSSSAWGATTSTPAGGFSWGTPSTPTKPATSAWGAWGSTATQWPVTSGASWGSGFQWGAKPKEEPALFATLDSDPYGLGQLTPGAATTAAATATPAAPTTTFSWSLTPIKPEEKKAAAGGDGKTPAAAGARSESKDVFTPLTPATATSTAVVVRAATPAPKSPVLSAHRSLLLEGCSGSAARKLSELRNRRSLGGMAVQHCWGDSNRLVLSRARNSRHIGAPLPMPHEVSVPSSSASP